MKDEGLDISTIRWTWRRGPQHVRGEVIQFVAEFTIENIHKQ